MAARHGQKIKLFHIVDILREYTDEEHPLTANEICERLSNLGITAERKAIYDDIECLISYGFDIINTRVPKSGYFLASREFEIPEIYLLGDAVRTAKFISAKKTRELTAKLDKMLSRYEKIGRGKGIYIDSSSKTKNEELFYNIDAISSAIKNNKKITLKYGTRNFGRQKDIDVSYKVRTVSPYAMTWQDDHYYLIANYEKYDNLMHMRIDRMKNVTETDEQRRPMGEVSSYTDCFDVADYTKKLFGMFGGEPEYVEIRANKEVLEQVADRFGENISISNLTDTHFTFGISAAVSEALVTWIMNYGVKMEVIKPEKLRNMIKNRAKSIHDLYK